MAVKRLHEIRDPIHNFIQLDRRERAFVDSQPFQRLRHINQLALSPLVYPGATHKRFEHSLGVMHLAQRVFDIVTKPENIHPDIEHIIPDRDDLHYWRTALSIAALAHNIGHIPFSHAAEKRLLERGADHETLTIDLLASDYLNSVWEFGYRIDPKDVQKLAVGQKKLRETSFTTWESILSEIITGDSFGVDRIDYLLRDSYHAGVTYGYFDHIKMIESLRILPKSSETEGSLEPTLGIELSGLHSSEAMLLARYFMYEQVYFHPVRRIYDQHLIDFMAQHYGENGYSRDIEFHLSQTDNEVTVAIRNAFRDRAAAGHLAAQAILGRQHYRLVYSYNPSDQQTLRESIEEGRLAIEENQPLVSPARRIFDLLCKEFGKENFKEDLYIQGASYAVFPVLMPDNRIEISISLSPVLRNFPRMTVDTIYTSPNMIEKSKTWIAKNRDRVLRGDLT